MSRLKNRQEFPPKGFIFVEPRAPLWNLPVGSSFDRAVMAIIEFRKANKWLITEHHLSTNPEQVAIELDEQNAARLLAEGFDHFVVGQETQAPAPANFTKPHLLSRVVAAATAPVKRVSAGVGVMKEWIGESLKPVEGHVAANRAAVCHTCPKNPRPTDPEWLDKLVKVAGESLKRMIEIKNGLNLTTKWDNELYICTACGCHIPLKVHVPLKFIKEKMVPEVEKALDQRCWIRWQKDEDETEKV